jgi:hypothetical protein
VGLSFIKSSYVSENNTLYMEHVAHTRKMRNAYKNLVPKSEGRESLRDLDIDGTVILKSQRNMK